MLRIAEAREARGYTQEQLAQAIGTTQQTIQRWESGQVTPRVDKVEDVSRALGITMSFLLGIDDNKKEHLSASEQEVIDIMRSVTVEGKNQLLIYARGIASSFPKNNQIYGHKAS